MMFKKTFEEQGILSQADVTINEAARDQEGNGFAG